MRAPCALFCSQLLNFSSRPNLQYKIRRDPPCVNAPEIAQKFSVLISPRSYHYDFGIQFRQYEMQRELFMQAPTSATDDGLILFRDLIDFVAHLADCYPELTAKVPEQLIEILELHHADLKSELREKIIGSLVLLRKKGILDSSRFEWLPNPSFYDD